MRFQAALESAAAQWSSHVARQFVPGLIQSESVEKKQKISELRPTLISSIGWIRCRIIGCILLHVVNNKCDTFTVARSFVLMAPHLQQQQ